MLTITGTDGKTTTVTLTGILVRCSGKTTGVVGNISLSTLGELSECANVDALLDVWVFELSNFQLEAMHALDTDAATVLNITQNHLDWCGTLEAYAAAKGRIFGANIVHALNRQDAGMMAFADKNGGNITFGTDEPGTPDALRLLCDGGML